MTVFGPIRSAYAVLETYVCLSSILPVSDFWTRFGNLKYHGITILPLRCEVLVVAVEVAVL
jgi:hypothetical protein